MSLSSLTNLSYKKYYKLMILETWNANKVFKVIYSCCSMPKGSLWHCHIWIKGKLVEYCQTWQLIVPLFGPLGSASCAIWRMARRAISRRVRQTTDVNKPSSECSKEARMASRHQSGCSILKALAGKSPAACAIERYYGRRLCLANSLQILLLESKHISGHYLGDLSVAHFKCTHSNSL